MSAVVGRVWGWVSPANLYSSWGSKTKPEKPPTSEIQARSRWGLWGLSGWVWRGEKTKTDQKTIAEDFREAEETIEPLNVEELRADVEREKAAGHSSSRWWSRMLPSRYFFWPRWSSSSSSPALLQRKCAGWSEGTWDSDEVDGQSDYGTPPPSPTPPKSAFQFFSRSWTGQIVPEHYDICFNFLRHLFDLFVVGFLTTVSPPTKFVLDVLGVQGALKLWLHGMAMFLVSSVGMAGLLWVVQEYLLVFALIYGVVQALVISVSVRQSEASAEGDDGKGDGEVRESEEEQDNIWEQNEPQQTGDESKKGVKQRS
ncbi:uncharacterized protein C6orf47 homolog [Puntigrus tetrazona]|uniref:uncharacterized protein C6orf47 homolog n=1 Tax=Puntigrus tetrazona TaxID=1606681 RepID=UPI001C8ABB32|nr:uncharacterized protein C6orf47 homolog [Puntigrus tetrazona]